MLGGEARVSQPRSECGGPVGRPRNDGGRETDGHVQGCLSDRAILEWYFSPSRATGRYAQPRPSALPAPLASGSSSRYRYRGEGILAPPRRPSVLMPDEVHSATEAEFRQALTMAPGAVRRSGPASRCRVRNRWRSPCLHAASFPYAVLLDDELGTRYQRLHTALEGDPSAARPRRRDAVDPLRRS